MSNFSLVQEGKIVTALAPAADAAGRSGAYISLKNCHKAYVLVSINQGHATPPALTLNKATAIAGTGATPVTEALRIWSNLDTATNDTLVRRTDAASYTPDAALKSKVVVFEIDPAALGDYDCIQLVTGASNALNITEAKYLLMPLRYPSATPPSAVID